MKETEFIKNLMYVLGRNEKYSLIMRSNLDDRESQIMIQRFVHGLSTKEVSEKMLMEMDCFKKFQQRIFRKLYVWIEMSGQYQKFNDLKKVGAAD